MKKLLSIAAALAVSSISVNAFAGGDIEAGKAAATKYNCASCHGVDFKNPTVPDYPKLAGQHQDYLAHALMEYRRGGDGPNGRSNPIMGAMAKSLSDDDIANLAAYLHSLPGSLVLEK